MARSGLDDLSEGNITETSLPHWHVVTILLLSSRGVDMLLLAKPEFLIRTDATHHQGEEPTDASGEDELSIKRISGR